MSRKFSFFLFGLLVAGSSARCQSVLNERLDGSENGKKLAAVLTGLETKYEARFFYIPAWLERFSFDRSYAGETVASALDDLFSGTDFSYIEMYPNAVVIVKDPKHEMQVLRILRSGSELGKKIDKVTIGNAALEQGSAGNFSLTGRVTDTENGAPLPHATIFVQDDSLSATSDEKGEYQLQLAGGAHVLAFSYLNYQERLMVVNTYADGSLDVALLEEPAMLNEVVIEDRSAREVATSQIGEMHIDVSQLKREPALLGEADIIKHIQQTAGVTTVGEAASGFNVRGGSVDENLVLYDDMPIFNSTHVFGLLSNLSADAIGSVSFYKGGIPSLYGGRCSSVLDIASRDGDFDHWHGAAGIGMINGRASVSGPLKKDKTAFAATVRSTYSNWLTHAVQTDYGNLKNSLVHFYDGDVKVTHRFNSGSRLSVNSYVSHDAFRLGNDSTYHWSTFQLSAALHKEFSGKLNADFRAGINNYGYDVVNAYPSTASKLSFRITSPILKAGFEYQLGNQKLSFGDQLTGYLFNPGTLKPQSITSNARRLQLDHERSIENAIWASDALTVGDRVFVEAGIRVPFFVSLGPASVNIYDEASAPSTVSITDTLHYGSLQPVKAYLNLEPRLSFRWMTGNSSSFKIGYNRMTQDLHLVTNTAAVAPEDIWQPSGTYFKPEIADQVSAGFFRDFSQGKFNFSIEGFYKKIDNVLDFRNGAQLTLNNHLETELLTGKGTAYGTEFTLNRNVGRLTWALNYTYSRAFRQFDGIGNRESINRGERYPANFDQPHVLNLSWRYNFSRRFLFTGDFTYHTGRPITIPTLIFPVDGGFVEYFSNRNEYRIPDYHRLDLALVVEGNHRLNRKVKGSWSFSVYNVYARKNPYTVFFRTDKHGIPHPYQLSIIGTIFPSVSYNLTFE